MLGGLGRPDPTNWAGLNPQLGLGRSRPRRDWANLDPTKSPIFVWAGLGPDNSDGPEIGLAHKHMAGPEPIWPREEKKTTMLGQNQPGPAT